MKYELVIKQGTKELFRTVAQVETTTFSVADGEKIIETEQFLERLFGYRFHINQLFSKQKETE